MNRLRYRLNLKPESAGSTESSFQIQEVFLKSFETFSLIESKGGSSGECLYDVLLKLVSEFDASGAAEIFRLLFERRSAIPL